MDRISLRGRLLSKKDVLENPERYKDRHVMIFELRDENYYTAARQFHKEWHGKMDKLVLALGFMPERFEDRAKNLFFAMRDELCNQMGDTSRANKDAVYHGLILGCEFRTVDGRVIESIKELDKRQLWELIQSTERELNETNETYEYRPQINDMARDYSKG